MTADGRPLTAVKSGYGGLRVAVGGHFLAKQNINLGNAG